MLASIDVLIFLLKPAVLKPCYTGHMWSCWLGHQVSNMSNRIAIHVSLVGTSWKMETTLRVRHCRLPTGLAYEMGNHRLN